MTSKPFPGASPAPLPPGMAAALNAIGNGDCAHVAAADIEHILRTGHGDGTLVRILFGDLSLDMLSWLGITFEIDEAALLAAYATAKAEAAAANPELDALLGRD